MSRNSWLSAIVLGCLVSATAHAQPAPLKIAILEDMSGVYSNLTGQGQVVAAQMAIDDFGGKVLGRPIQLLFADHQNKADVASTIVRRWFDIDGVELIAGLGNSAVGLAAQTVAKEKHRVDIITSAGASELTGSGCAPDGFQWAFDTNATAKVIASSIVHTGGKRWYFISADYTFGAALQKAASTYILSSGGQIVGSSKVPLATSDFSTYLVSAQSADADVVALANGGQDTDNAIKQAAEFGLVAQGRKLAALSMYINDVKGLGVSEAQGLYLSESFYWDLNDATRAWSQRYFARAHGMPNMLQAGLYSGIMHYLQAVQATGTVDGDKVAAEMHKTPVNDFYSKDVMIRQDGLVIRPMYLLQVKTPAESHGPWDLLKVVQAVPGDQAFDKPDPACPLVAR